MDDEQLKRQIGGNIASYRKQLGLTQVGLAEKLNYSDKAISKWERGESMPDVVTLIALAEQFGITVNDLLQDPNSLPEDTGRFQQAMEQVAEKTLRRKANKNIIAMLSSILVWSVALLIFVIVSSFGIPGSWLAFFAAIPADAIVILSLRSAWHDYRWHRFLISAIMWGTLLAIFMIVLVVWSFSLWKIFLLGIPGQLAILLWFQLFKTTPAENPSKEEENTHG